MKTASKASHKYLLFRYRYLCWGQKWCSSSKFARLSAIAVQRFLLRLGKCAPEVDLLVLGTKVVHYLVQNTLV